MPKFACRWRPIVAAGILCLSLSQEARAIYDVQPGSLDRLAGTIWGLSEMLARGYVVVAADYPGLGTPGMHPYLIGESEGRAVLDSVRAARDLPDAGASNRFAVWGHSQGGHASLYTGELAASSAPDLRLVGVRRHLPPI